jgi:hypothetical protein
MAQRMSQSYNIYYIGEVLEGQDTAAVRSRLGRLFNASDATLDKLFSGSPQLLKRDCDHGTALKYKQAMERAGARPRIRRSEDGAPASAAPQAAAKAAQSAPREAAAETTAADRIAAFIGGADTGDAEPGRSPAPSSAPEQRPGGLAVEPVGADILRPHERKPAAPADIDVGALSLAEPGPLPAPPAAAPPAPPTIAHLSLEETGELIPNLPPSQPAREPDISAIALCDGGYDLSDCAPPAADPPALDLSELTLGPQGSPVLDERYRRGAPPAAPDTAHISLAEDPAAGTPAAGTPAAGTPAADHR